MTKLFGTKKAAIISLPLKKPMKFYGAVVAVGSLPLLTMMVILVPYSTVSPT